MDTKTKSYPSDISDAEWEFLAPYLKLMRKDAPQRGHSPATCSTVSATSSRRVANGGTCRTTFRRGQRAGVFEKVAHDLRMIVRLVEEREAQPTATILDDRTLQSTPESVSRAGFNGTR